MKKTLEKQREAAKILKSDPVLFSEEDREEDEKSQLWYDEFEKSLREENEKEAGSGFKNISQKESGKEETKHLSPMVRANIQRSNNIYNAYKTGEEWLMSEGDEDLIKGIINNFRSAIGTGVEDLAYAINDFAPWYKPAENVIEENTAGKIAETAQKQFGNAKEKGAGENFVNGLDTLSKNAGYNIFGAKAGNYAEALSEGFGEYKKLREQGYSKEEAAAISLGKISSEFLFSKADDYLLKNNKIDEVLYGRAHAFNPKDNEKFREALNSRNTNDIIITEKQIGEKIREHTKDYGLNPGNVDDRIKFLNIIDDIIDNADEIVIGDNWRGQTGRPKFYIKGKDVVVTIEDSKKFVTILEGGITNARVKNAGR